MFRENTLDYIKELRAWSVNLASRTYERKPNVTHEVVLAAAAEYLNYVTDFTVEDAMKEHAKRQDYIESLRNKVEVDAALAEELTNARNALKAAKEASTEEEANQLLRSAEFSFEQVCETVARDVSAAAGLNQPEALAKEI
jgi:hypothetical protein